MIRHAQPADAQAVARVQVAAWHAAYRGILPDAVLDRFTLEVRRDRWREILANADSARTTVFERGGVIAFVSVGPSRDEPGSGEIWALYVHPDVWGSGAARALVVEGLAHLESCGFHRVMLWVLEANARAIRFYERAGFRLDGGRKEADGVFLVRMVNEARRDAVP